MTVSHSPQMILSFKLWHILHLSPFGTVKIEFIYFTYDLQFILINIKNVKGVHYSCHLDVQFTVVFMTVSHSAHMLLKLEKCIPISHVILETVPKYVNIERPSLCQLFLPLPCNNARYRMSIFLQH